jgi:hypothetical protein
MQVSLTGKRRHRALQVRGGLFRRAKTLLVLQVEEKREGVVYISGQCEWEAYTVWRDAKPEDLEPSPCP